MGHLAPVLSASFANSFSNFLPYGAWLKLKSPSLTQLFPCPPSPDLLSADLILNGYLCIVLLSPGFFLPPPSFPLSFFASRHLRCRFFSSFDEDTPFACFLLSSWRGCFVNLGPAITITSARLKGYFLQSTASHSIAQTGDNSGLPPHWISLPWTLINDRVRINGSRLFCPVA